jgi:uncharacterized PurR-regulated membrane protein YhhQ (DUF165 family)
VTVNRRGTRAADQSDTGWHQPRIRRSARIAWLAGYVSCIYLANWFIANVGTQDVPAGPHVIPVGLGLEAPSGVLWAGAALVARDLVQLSSGRAVAILAMLLGTALSYFVAPNLALASAIAFGLSEAADFAVYTPISRSGYVALSVFASGGVGLLVDTFAFLWLAFGDLHYWEGQALGKFWVTSAAAIVLFGLRRTGRMGAYRSVDGRWQTQRVGPHDAG